MITARIDAIAAGGDGVARLEDGRVAFVPRSAPGDLVQLRIVHAAKRFVRAQISAVLEPGPERVDAPCEHYEHDQCGGCQLMHLSTAGQQAARRRIVGDALRRVGGLEVEDPPLVPAPMQLGYRAKLTLHASADGRRIGLHRQGRADQLFALRRCLVAAPAVAALWAALRPRLRLLPPSLQTLILREDQQGGRHLIAVCREPQVWTQAAELARELAGAGVRAALWWQPPSGAARVVAGGDGESYPATVFEQVHPAMGRAARAAALAALGSVAGQHVWDLYAGIGETTAALLDAGATVESIELDGRAVVFAEQQRPGDGARVVRMAGRVEDRVSSLRPAAAAIVNPPRGGLDSRAVTALAERGPARVVYVSCDPATLARDLKGMSAAYRLAALTAFDLFPQTAHVESVAVLERT